MIEKEIIIKNKLGIHARPAAMIVKTAGIYLSKITFSKNGLSVNGKSIMDLLILEAVKGSKLKLTVKGKDEYEAFNALIELIERGFDEE